MAIISEMETLSRPARAARIETHPLGCGGRGAAVAARKGREDRNTHSSRSSLCQSVAARKGREDRNKGGRLSL